MKFDLSWFTTISGMFITGGVILLIIALIILLVTGRNSKKAKKEKAVTTDTTNNVNSNTQTAVPEQINNVSTGVEQNQVVVNPQSAIPESFSTTPSVPIANNTVPIVSTPVENVSNVGSMPVQAPVSNFGESSTMSPGSPDLGLLTNQNNPPSSEIMNSISTSNFDGGVQTSNNSNGFSMPEEPIPVVQPVNNTSVVDSVVPSFDPAIVPNGIPSVPVDSVVPSPEVIPAPVEVAPQPVENMSALTEVSPIPNVASTVPMESIPVVAETSPTPVENTNIESPSVSYENPVPVVSNPVPQIVEPVAVAAPTPAPTPTPVIYGGASPAVAGFNVNQENHQIYGGADPLQNTQTIPNTIAPVPSAPVVTEPGMISPQPVDVVPNVVVSPPDVSINQGVPPIQ